MSREERVSAELKFHERLIPRKLGVALSVSAYMLLFAQDERGSDDDLGLQFEAASRLDPEGEEVIRSVFANADSGVTPR